MHFNNNDFVWYSFSSHVEIRAVAARFMHLVVVEFYDFDNNLLERYELISNDQVETHPWQMQLPLLRME